MERQIWADMKAKNLAAVEAKIAPGFQSVHPDGARDRAGEIALIKGLNVGPYTLKDFKVTKNGDLLIVTYSITVAETVDGKSFPPGLRCDRACGQRTPPAGNGSLTRTSIRCNSCSISTATVTRPVSAPR